MIGLNFVLIFLIFYPWPMRDFSVAHGVSGTLGDARGTQTSPRFHWGVDIPASAGTDVFSIISGVASTLGERVRVGDYWYIHLDNPIENGEGVLGILDTISTPPTQIGDVAVDHLHFQIGTSGPPEGPFYNPLFYDGGPVGYDDTGDPTCSIDFWRQGSEGTTAHQLTGVLDGKIDIRARCQDIQTSGGSNQTSGIYRLEWAVQNIGTGESFGPFETTIFPQVEPPNNGAPVLLVYDRHNYTASSPFYYWATNPIVNNQVEDRYWNTKQKIGAPDSVDAESLEVAKFPDGHYWVKVLTYDIRNNADTESVYVQVANFRPKVKETDPANGETEVSIHSHINIHFSEAMDQNIALWQVISISPGVSGDWMWLSNQEIEFFPDPAFVENINYTVSLSSQIKDTQGQELIPYEFSFTTETSDDYECYPVAFVWEGARGGDFVDFRTTPYLMNVMTFSFPFYSQSFDWIYGVKTGNIWFDYPDYTLHFDLPTANGHTYGVLAAYNDSIIVSIIPPFVGRGWSIEKSNPRRKIFEWEYTYLGDTTSFEARLFPDGIIIYDYRKCDIETFWSDGGSGISKGDGIHYAMVPGAVYELAPGSYLFTQGQPPPGRPRDPYASWPARSEFVNLTWRENPEPDLEGYNVYRRRDDSLSYVNLAFTEVNHFTDTLIELGNSYVYRITALDTFDLESPYSDSVIVEYGPRPAYDSLATAYNNGRKIVSNPGGDEVHFVYSSDSIYYCYSSDSGKSFSAGEYIGPGLYAMIALNTTGKPCISWISDSILYYSYLNITWTSFNIILPVVLSQPSMIVDAFDTVHMVVCRYDVQDSDYGDLLYVKFPRTNFEYMVIETLLVNNFCRTPSLAGDFSGDINILWQGENCLCYRSKDITGWSEIDTIYTTTSGEALYPVIDVYGSTITAVWHDKDISENLQIYSRMKHDSVWETINQVASTTGESRYPSLANAHYCLWQDKTSGNWEVYTSEYIGATEIWSAPENISNSSPASQYPHGFCTVINGAARLCALWTEGDASPFEVKTYSSIFTPSGYVLNLDSFPMYEAEAPYNEMCGPAVAQMALNYMYWNKITHPEGPPMLPQFAQDSLYEYGIAYNADPESEYFDLQGMWHTIQDKKPMPYVEYGYNFTKRHNTDQYIMLKLICQWIDYTVGTYGGHKDGHPYHVPSIVPAYGDYTNWMAVRGIHTDVPAYPMPDTLIIYGFWVNDPYPVSMGGIGENSYKIISDWNSIYYVPMTVGDYIGEYLAVFEPPESGENCHVILAQPIPRFSSVQMHQLDAMTDRFVIQRDINSWIIQAAIDGVTEHLIPYDKKFAELFAITSPSQPLFVESMNGNDYYIVPFRLNSAAPKKARDRIIKEIEITTRVKTNSDVKDISKIKAGSDIEDTGHVGVIPDSIVSVRVVSVKLAKPIIIDTQEKIVVVILIDANDGHFKEVSWTSAPVTYLPLSKEHAQHIAFAIAEELGIEIEGIHELHPELIHRKSTPYYPEWRVILGEYAIYISQDGSVSIEEFVDGEQGGGVMSETAGVFVYSLNVAAPSPFVKNTTIFYSVAKPGHVSLRVYDVSGRLVKILIDEKKNAGAYNIVWNGCDEHNDEVAPGVYFTRLTSSNFTSVKKVIVVR
jgi:hypothetical protein